MARPQKQINWDLVEKMMEAGNNAKQIYTHFRISANTFHDKFKEEYGGSFSDFSNQYQQCGDGNLHYTQYMKALSGNVQMLIFLGKVRLGQREPDSTPLIPPAQEELTKDHIIMKLEYELQRLKSNVNTSTSEDQP